MIGAGTGAPGPSWNSSQKRQPSVQGDRGMLPPSDVMRDGVQILTFALEEVRGAGRQIACGIPWRELQGRCCSANRTQAPTCCGTTPIAKGPRIDVQPGRLASTGLPKRQFVWVDAEGKGKAATGYDHHDGMSLSWVRAGHARRRPPRSFHLLAAWPSLRGREAGRPLRRSCDRRRSSGSCWSRRRQLQAEAALDPKGPCSASGP